MRRDGIDRDRGRSEIGLSELLTVLTTDRTMLEASVILHIRLPRTVITVLLGINLSLASVVLKAVMRNPLASPTVLGINQGAALGITTSLIFPTLFGTNIAVMAVIGAFSAAVLTFIIASGLSDRLNSTLILSGVAVGALSYAMVRFAFTLEDDLARSVIMWTVGDISDFRWRNAVPLLIFTGLGSMVAYFMSYRFNLMALGEVSSKGLGVDPRKTLFVGAILAAFLVGTSVAMAGPMGFVGLVIPHISRILFGSGHRVLISETALIGATLMATADATSKILLAPAKVPVGVIASLIGAPYFLYQTILAKNLQ